jgi:pescadillo protein
MGKRIKAGTKGASAQYVTRAKAVRQLQISLKDFRRLCILKGIYPREPPKNPNQAQSHTYYHKKDVLFLSREPLLNKFREFKIFLRKHKRAVTRKEFGIAKDLLNRKPKLVLDHLVRERYPTFLDALRDMDDPLTLLHTFSMLPPGIISSFDASKAAICTRLIREFNNYVVQSNSLKKVFVSIKGTYFQAEIQNQKITWIVPHKFNYNNQSDVDFKVMQTFLDFYQTLAKFVNYKLFHDLGLVYPPQINLDREINGLGLSALINKKAVTAEEQQEIEEFKKDAEEFAQSNGSHESLDGLSGQSAKLLFSGLKFFLGRETPQENLELVILSLGGQAILETSADTKSVDDKDITHHVVDRPLPANKQLQNREYIQPQWVFDSLNANALLPISPYAPVSFTIYISVILT